MGVNMKELGIVVAAALAITVAFFLLVDFANAKETTTLEDALERPVVLERSYDNDTGVVCYWAVRYPQYIACVQVQGLTPAQHRKLINE
jgi:hypothetical protein